MWSGRRSELRGGLQPAASRPSDSAVSSADQMLSLDPCLCPLGVTSYQPVLRNPEEPEITAGCSPVKRSHFHNRVFSRMILSS